MAIVGLQESAEAVVPRATSREHRMASQLGKAWHWAWPIARISLDARTEGPHSCTSAHAEPLGSTSSMRLSSSSRPAFCDGPAVAITDDDLLRCIATCGHENDPRLSAQARIPQ